MDAMECRSPARCRSCEHWSANACELERQLETLYAPRAPALVVTLARAST